MVLPVVAVVVLCPAHPLLAPAGESREIARKGMVMALSQLRIKGEIRTTSEYVMNLLERPGMGACPLRPQACLGSVQPVTADVVSR